MRGPVVRWFEGTVPGACVRCSEGIRVAAGGTGSAWGPLASRLSPPAGPVVRWFEGTVPGACAVRCSEGIRVAAGGTGSAWGPLASRLSPPAGPVVRRPGRSTWPCRFPLVGPPPARGRCPAPESRSWPSAPDHHEAGRAPDWRAAAPVPTPVGVPAGRHPPVRAGWSAEPSWKVFRLGRPPGRSPIAHPGAAVPSVASRAPAVPGSGPSGRPVTRGWPARAGPYRGTDSPIQEMRCGKIRPTVS